MPFQFRKEAIEEDLNTNFPSQGQGNPPLYYSLSEVVVPTYSINNVAEGSSLPQNLQTAFDFSSGHDQVSNTTTTIINNPGFWLLNVNVTGHSANSALSGDISITDGLSTKKLYQVTLPAEGIASFAIGTELGTPMVVFVRGGDSVTATTNAAVLFLNVTYRQIADVNGNLVNPLGFSAA